MDAVLLAAAVDAKPGESVLDLGAGVGAVGLCIAARVPDCHVTGIELQPALAALAARNAVLNDAADRVVTVVHDLAHPLPPGLGPFDHVVTNPPYLPAAVADPSPDRSKALATVESSADLARWLTVATEALKPAGTLLVIHRSDRLEEIVGALVRFGWGDVTVKRLPPAARVLVRARRADELRRHDAQPLVLHRPESGYTDEAEAILRHGQPLAF
ncbi:methyltransferase [Reyranella sp.]|uniref:tRNA1(Val) (adenine(37)-N6)-methyltransferase n=1 Tax=Reyranella sp. TaxID=1929291 RepID=UPI0025DEC93E|nr:methyltransferase [Reyranella sp.]